MACFCYNVSMPQYRCPNCHKLFEWPNKACPHCGMRITIAKDKAKPLYCSDCGAELYEGKQFCPSCGSDQSIKEPQQVQVVEVKTSGNHSNVPLILALIACGIAQFAFYFFYVFGFMAIGSLVLGIIATIMGAIQFKRSSNAKTGMILGIIAIGLSIVALVLLAALVVAIVVIITQVI